MSVFVDTHHSQVTPMVKVNHRPTWPGTRHLVTCQGTHHSQPLCPMVPPRMPHNLMPQGTPHSQQLCPCQLMVQGIPYSPTPLSRTPRRPGVTCHLHSLILMVSSTGSGPVLQH